MKAFQSSGVRLFAFGVLSAVLTSLAVVCLTLYAQRAERMFSQRLKCARRQHQLYSAMVKYAAEHKVFPRARFAVAGGPLYSWRVEVGRYIIDDYPRFDPALDWKTGMNAIVVKQQAFRFQCPSANQLDPRSIETHVMVIIGDHALFNHDRPRSFDDVPDGKSSTIMCAETYRSGVGWPFPGDLDISAMSFRVNEPNEKHQAIRSMHPGGALIVFADGSVRFVSNRAHPQIVRAMATCDGGEGIDAASWELLIEQ